MMRRNRSKKRLAAEYESLISQHGWLEVNANRTIWIPCPPVFQPGESRDSWARLFAQAWWENSPLPHGQAQIAHLAQVLALVYDGLYRDLASQLSWLHLPDPRILPLPLRAGIWAAQGEREQRLRMLANADDLDAVEPPKVTEFSTEDLGTGLKTVRYLRIGEGTEIGCAVNYAWRSERYQTDVRLFTSCDDLERLDRAIPDIEDFIRSMRIVERTS
jgi:hypothetical protein